MNNKLLHTPEGVRDIYNGECRKKLALQEKLHQTLLSYGCRDIQTPTFEFFNIFSREIGTTPSRDLYKFFDKEGNTLVLRPDFTPSIARSAVKYYMDEQIPVKLCYMGNSFINSTSYQGRLKEVTQCGTEFIGDASITADAEILSLAVEALRASGLTDFQISVGHAQFFFGLVAAAGLNEEEEEQIRELISNKNFFGVEEFLATLKIDDNLKQLFTMLGNFNTKTEDLNLAMEAAFGHPDILKALKDLEELDQIIKLYGIEKYISFELGIISEYHYYTGIVFSGYTFGSGEPIIKGGRYDKLLSHFGKEAPAIGFAITVDQLLAALSRQNIRLDTSQSSRLLVYQKEHLADAIQLAGGLRKQGIHTEMLLWDASKAREDYEVYAKKNEIGSVDFL